MVKERAQHSMHVFWRVWACSPRFFLHPARELLQLCSHCHDTRLVLASLVCVVAVSVPASPPPPPVCLSVSLLGSCCA